jgi:hypothetical protein
MRLLLASLLAAAIVMPAFAAVTAPPLPSTAKKLTGAEIIALYDGASITWDNFSQKQEMTGTADLDLKKKTQTGTWQSGKDSGNFSGTAMVKGDKFCHRVKPSKEVCDSVYTDGNDIYEVNDKGIVDSKNMKK